MAPETAMKPDDAIETLRSVREYREDLTSQAAGFIWMIWGFVLLGMGLASQTAFLSGRYANYHIGWMDPLTTVLFPVAGGILTSVVYKMLAIQPKQPAWKIWLIGGVAIAVLGSLSLASNALFDFGPTAIMMAPLALLGAVLAVVLTILMREQAAMLPGFIASGVLFVAFLNVRFATFTEGPGADLLGNGALSLLNLVAFFVVGYIHTRRG